MTRTIGAAVGVLIVVFFMATIATRMARPSSSSSSPTLVSQR
jgi:hypothetical protein